MPSSAQPMAIALISADIAWVSCRRKVYTKSSQPKFYLREWRCSHPNEELLVLMAAGEEESQVAHVPVNGLTFMQSAVMTFHELLEIKNK